MTARVRIPLRESVPAVTAAARRLIPVEKANRLGYMTP